MATKVTVLVPYNDGLEDDSIPDVLEGHLTDEQLQRAAEHLGAVGNDGYAKAHVEDDLIWFENDSDEGPFATYEECKEKGHGVVGDLTYRVVKTEVGRDPRLRKAVYR